MKILRNRGRPLALVVVLSGTLAILSTMSAFAQAPILSGRLSCDNNGEQRVTWTITNPDTTLRMEILPPPQTGVSLGTLEGIGGGEQLAPGASITALTEIENPTLTGPITLTVTGHFFNATTSFDATSMLTLSLAGNCTPPPTCTALSSASAAGNSGQVKPGQFLWFNFHFTPTAKPNVPTTYTLTNVQIQFTDTLTGKVFTEAAPNATITLNDTSVTTPTSTFVGPQVGGRWVIQIPPSSSNSDEIFLTGFAFQNTSTVNIQPKNFNISADFNTSTGGTSVSWQFGVALYNSQFMDNGYTGLGVLLIHQADHAGTPELEKGNFIGGAGTGGGGSNFTGSWSSTGHAVCQ